MSTLPRLNVARVVCCGCAVYQLSRDEKLYASYRVMTNYFLGCLNGLSQSIFIYCVVICSVEILLLDLLLLLLYSWGRICFVLCCVVCCVVCVYVCVCFSFHCVFSYAATMIDSLGESKVHTHSRHVLLHRPDQTTIFFMKCKCDFTAAQIERHVSDGFRRRARSHGKVARLFASDAVRVAYNVGCPDSPLTLV